MSSSGVEIWRGGVAPWETDQMGHLNVGFYISKTMEALVGMAAELGMPGAYGPAAPATLVVKEHHIRFLREARPGTRLHITAGVVELGEGDARLLLLMHQDSGDLAASFQTVVAHATAGDAVSFPWPDRVRTRAEALKVDIPLKAAARSINLEPVETKASLERAQKLGLKRTGMGAVLAADCDVFGRLRTELIMHRISRSVHHLFGRPRSIDDDQHEDMGRAAVEYRLIYHAWPKAGDRIRDARGLLRHRCDHPAIGSLAVGSANRALLGVCRGGDDRFRSGHPKDNQDSPGRRETAARAVHRGLGPLG